MVETVFFLKTLYFIIISEKIKSSEGKMCETKVAQMIQVRV